MNTPERRSWKVVGYFIHYPQIIHTAFRGAVYLMILKPARAKMRRKPFFQTGSC